MLSPTITDAGLESVFQSTRALLWVRTPADAAQVARHMVAALGGTTVWAGSSPDALAVDVSFGEGAPVFPCAPPESTARTLLERYLPTFVVDAQRALEVASQASRLAGGVAWEENRPHPVTFSAGVGRRAHDPSAALRAADRAMGRAKTAGRDQWQWATEDDYAQPGLPI